MLMRPTHAVVNGKTIQLLTSIELEEFSYKLKEFKGDDYRGILTLMIFYNLFDDFLDSDEHIWEKYKVFMNTTNEMSRESETTH
tara:strand:- start:1306 stop:1557 length:252 start_codon:yes stop_codon:yes gene_type:complete